MPEPIGDCIVDIVLSMAQIKTYTDFVMVVRLACKYVYTADSSILYALALDFPQIHMLDLIKTSYHVISYFTAPQHVYEHCYVPDVGGNLDVV